jgi:hypothetical protein
MAGRSTIQYLAPKTYATFYRLAHAFSEEILAPFTTIEGVAYILTFQYQQLAAATDGDIARVTEAAARAAQVRGAARQAAIDVRQCFWPDDDHHMVNESRWFPYDARAWDTFFGQVIRVLEPRLPQLAAGYQHLQALGDGVGGAGAPPAWAGIERLPLAGIAQLHTLLTVAGFEARLFRGRPAERDRADP